MMLHSKTGLAIGEESLDAAKFVAALDDLREQIERALPGAGEPTYADVLVAAFGMWLDGADDEDEAVERFTGIAYAFWELAAARAHQQGLNRSVVLLGLVQGMSESFERWHSEHEEMGGSAQ